MQHIYFIRHAESEHNGTANLLSGTSDVPLSDHGITESKRLAATMLKLNIETIISSPLMRAVHTTQLLFPDQPFIVDDSLIEFDYGDYEGVSGNDNTDHVLRQWNNNPADLRFPNGGHIKEHANSVLVGVNELVTSIDSTHIALVSHRTTGRLLVAMVLGMDLNLFRSIPMDNCSLSEFVLLDTGRLSLKSLNLDISIFD